MNPINQTRVDNFIIKGISDVQELQLIVFLLVLLIYLFTLCGNMTMLLLVCCDCQLHTPMYFFLANLSIIDVSSSTITLHRSLTNFIFRDKTISVFTCMAQMYIFLSLTSDELLLLTAMSYDRYTAICNPLRYHTVMSRRVNALLVTVCWLVGFIQVVPIVVSLSGYNCYISNEINHFFCDITPLAKLSCNDVSFLELYIFINGIFLVIFPFSLTFIPYIFIILAILKIRTSTGRRKAFYTCSSHLTVIILLYVTLICQYLRPNSMDSLESKKLFSLFNTAAVPMLNPLIYSLKNKDVKFALKRRLNLLWKH
ncbi:olfactory receptor 8J3-like [Pseudophryne corroboree]|uniref:olfactory receptor 8J3-like n=1 Tax=Pseudophryne corroboree TaxID=495146 RepID=UPI0030814D06